MHPNGIGPNRRRSRSATVLVVRGVFWDVLIVAMPNLGL
jgi:hypothetical protein